MLSVSGDEEKRVRAADVSVRPEDRRELDHPEMTVIPRQRALHHLGREVAPVRRNFQLEPVPAAKVGSSLAIQTSARP